MLCNTEFVYAVSLWISGSNAYQIAIDSGNPNTYTYKMLLPNDYKQQKMLYRKGYVIVFINYRPAKDMIN